MGQKTPRSRLNLGQLHQNKWTDKTSGWKRLHPDDMEVTAAGDFDDDVIAALVAALFLCHLCLHIQLSASWRKQLE
jgi:hypothetical protein